MKTAWIPKPGDSVEQKSTFRVGTCEGSTEMGGDKVFVRFSESEIHSIPIKDLKPSGTEHIVSGSEGYISIVGGMAQFFHYKYINHVNIDSPFYESWMEYILHTETTN